MNRRMLGAIALVLTAVAALVGAAGAAAGAPERWTREIDVTFDDFAAPCDGYSLVGRFVGTLTFVRFTDEEGNFEKLVIHRNIQGTITNPVSGNTYPLREHDKATFYADDTAKFTGLLLQVYVPNGPPIAMVAGLDANGELHGRFDALCEALS